MNKDNGKYVYSENHMISTQKAIFSAPVNYLSLFRLYVRSNPNNNIFYFSDSVMNKMLHFPFSCGFVYCVSLIWYHLQLEALSEIKAALKYSMSLNSSCMTQTATI